MSAADEYRAVIARLDAVADGLRERDAERAVTLRAALPGLDKAVEEADARAAVTRFAVDLHWEAALEVLWPEQWLKLRPRPGPDPRAAAADIESLDTAVAEATEALLATVRRRWRLPGR